MELEQAVTNYTPTAEIINTVRQTKIVLLVGIAGAGKDSIKQQLILQPDYQDIVSHTTRAPRTNNGVPEINDVDYHFIDNETAFTMIQHHDFIEIKFVHGTIYGTSTAEVQKSRVADTIAITDVDVQGVDEYKELSSSVVAIFILPPDYKTWRHRLSARYNSEEEFEAEFPKRRQSAIRELTHALEVSYYHFIINDQLEVAVQGADKVAHKPDTFHRKDDEARLAARDLLQAIIAAE